METAQRKEMHTGFPGEFFARMARAGALAPSGDNLQPWSFAADGDSLLLKHDPARDLSLFNVRHLASFIALGAAIENITIAASGEGYRANVTCFPYGADDEIVARLSFDPAGQTDPLAKFLSARCTNRRPFEKKALAPEILASLDATKHFPTTTLSWVQDRTKLKALGKIVARADRLIFENQRIHDHLFSTLRWSQAEVEQTRDGLPIESLELGKIGSIAFRGLKRWSVVSFLNHLGFSRAAAANSILLMQRCSAAGMITAPDLSPSSFMEAGRAFQRLWLQATKENLALQPMTAIIFFQLRSRLADYDGLSEEQISIVDALRQELREFFALSEDRVPAMLFRIGYAVAPSARTIRRETKLQF
jgi:sulfur-carrier protein adenylyltransferase/sulfurtransferase